MFESIRPYLVTIRYLHIIAMALMVGGTLFFEMVVPLAIGELKDEQQLAVMGRFRWVFKRVIYVSSLILLLTGSFSLYRNWRAYSGEESVALQAVSGIPDQDIERPKPLHLSGWWAIAHAGVSLLSIGIAIGLVSGGTPPQRPIKWMRINLVILLVGIFLASASRYARIRSIDVIWNAKTVQELRD